MSCCRKFISCSSGSQPITSIPTHEYVCSNNRSVSSYFCRIFLPLLSGRYESINYSIALPFLPRPVQLDGSHAGDNGFDPLGFTEDYDIYYMQECELRHARLAMLAVVGWPVSELLGPEALLQDDRAPSVLNGFSVYTGVATLLAFSALALFELNTWNRRTVGTPMGNTHIQDMKNIWHIGVAGDYNFDPAGLYNSLGDDPVGRKAMRSMEITQGRWAMLAITYFAWYEAISGKPVVADNMFFHPNAILPALGVAYLIGSSLYEVSDPKQYPIKIQKSKLGKELDEWTERRKQGEEGRA